MIQQLSVFVVNEIGSISKVTTILTQHQISLKAIASFDSPEFCILRMVVDDPQKAKEILTKEGYGVKLTEVLAVELEDKLGELNRLLCTIAQENIALNYIYSFVLRNKKEPLMLINTDEIKKCAQILKDNGFLVASEQDLKYDN